MCAKEGKREALVTLLAFVFKCPNLIRVAYSIVAVFALESICELLLKLLKFMLWERNRFFVLTDGCRLQVDSLGREESD